MYEFSNRSTGEKLLCRFAVCDPNKPETIRWLQECVRDEYGESYPMKCIYDTQLFAAKLRGDDMTAILALTEENEPVASLALAPSGDLKGVRELTMHVVCRRYRGFHVGTALTKALIEQPEVQKLCSVTAHAVTFHPKAQHQTLSCGLVPTGFLFMVHSNRILHHTFSVEGVDKQSLAVAVKAERKRNAGTLYAPSEHRAFIESIYHRLGVDFVFAEGSEPKGECRISSKQDEEHHTRTLMLYCGGAGLEERLDAYLNAEHFPDQTMSVFLDMNSPSAPFTYQLLKDRGFIFSGLQPLCENGEFIILNHPMGMRVPFERLSIDDGYKELFDYIRARA